jgi:hypothetical protein
MAIDTLIARTDIEPEARMRSAKGDTSGIAIDEMTTEMTKSAGTAGNDGGARPKEQHRQFNTCPRQR